MELAQSPQTPHCSLGKRKEHDDHGEAILAPRKVARLQSDHHNGPFPLNEDSPLHETSNSQKQPQSVFLEPEDTTSISDQSGRPDPQVQASPPKPVDNDPRYVDLEALGLEPWFSLRWSNDPKKMHLEYFEEPGGLGTEWGLTGLRPLLVEENFDGYPVFVMMDDTETFFIWDEEYDSYEDLRRVPGKYNLEQFIHMFFYTDDWDESKLVGHFSDMEKSGQKHYERTWKDHELMGYREK